MKTWIRFDTDTGITVPPAVRDAVLAAAHPHKAATLAGDEQSWIDSLPVDAMEDGAIVVSPYGATTIKSFSGDLGYHELAILKACVQYGSRGESAVILEESDARGTVQLHVCDGDGTATVHDAQTVFPTYGESAPLPTNADALSMEEATRQWETARELGSSKTSTAAARAARTANQPVVIPGRTSRTLPPPTRGALSIAEEEVRRAYPERPQRQNRSEPHGEGTPGTASPSPRL